MKNLTLLALLFVCQVVLAQSDEIPFTDLPPNPGDGKCYAKCKIPDRYETVKVQKLKKAGTSKTVDAKPEYRTVTERVMIKEASEKFIYKPAVYETVQKRIMVKEGYCKRKVVPAKYTFKQTNRRLVESAGGRWVRKKKDPGCLSENPDDCFIMCWEDTPAKYEYDTEKVLVSAATEDVQQFDAEYTTINVRVIKEPARYDRVEIPAQYKTITKKVLATPGCLEPRVVTSEDQYELVNEKRLVSSGGYTGWVEILCASKTTNNVVLSVQKQLNAKGYNVGAADGILGIRTRAQLEKYQKDNGLPVGNLNIQTLESLGVDAN